MKVCLMTQSSVVTFIAASSIGFASPSAAATFANFSQIELVISNFSHLPKNVGVVGDVKAISIAEVGEVEIQLDGDAIFLSDDSNSIAFGSSKFQTSISGTGLDYLGRTDILANLIGQFDVPANTTFGFDVQASVLLTNWTDDLALSPVSTSGNFQLILQDVLNQKDWHIFNFLGFLNTNSIDELNRDWFEFYAGINLNVLEYQEATIFGGNNEALQFFLTASFEISVNESTELMLLATTRSCNYGSNVVDVCVRVPEPSNRLSLMVGAIWLSAFFFSSRIIKQIVKLTRQPFIKHFVKNFLVNFRS